MRNTSDLKAEAARLREEKTGSQKENVELQPQAGGVRAAAGRGAGEDCRVEARAVRPEVGPSDTGAAGTTVPVESRSRSGSATPSRGERRDPRRRRGRKRRKNGAGPVIAAASVIRCRHTLKPRRSRSSRKSSPALAAGRCPRGSAKRSAKRSTSFRRN